jgi:hypothetical protein
VCMAVPKAPMPEHASHDFTLAPLYMASDGGCHRDATVNDG